MLFGHNVEGLFPKWRFSSRAKTLTSYVVLFECEFLNHWSIQQELNAKRIDGKSF